MDEAMRDYLIGFDPANDKTLSEALHELAQVSQHAALTMDEWWNSFEWPDNPDDEIDMAYEAYIADMGAIDGPSGEGE